MRRELLIVAAALVGYAACDDSPAGPEARTYVIDVEGETFRVRVRDAATIAALDARRASGAEGVINGELVAGDGGFNEPWSWHLDPASIEVPDFAVEVCDGTPSMVEADLAYWLDTVERYCPWGAEVVAVED